MAVDDLVENAAKAPNVTCGVAQTNINAWRRTNTHTHTHIYIYMYMCVYAHTHTHLFMYARTHVYIHIYIYIFMYTHIIHTMYLSFLGDKKMYDLGIEAPL